MATSPKVLIGCIGKCSTGLNSAELDIITDHIYKTLNHDKGRRIFREFLLQAKRIDDIACLDLYEKICESINAEGIHCHSTSGASSISFITSANEILDIAVNLNGVPEIDMALLERFNGYLTTCHTESILTTLVEMKKRLIDHLTNAHMQFRIYLLQPCPNT